MGDFNTVSVVETNGTRHVWVSARVLGIRAGHLFIEEQTPFQQDTDVFKSPAGDAGLTIPMTQMNMHILPLGDVEALTTDTNVDDDYGQTGDLMGSMFDEDWNLNLPQS